MKMPLPFAYAHHIKAFLVVFAATAPFALVDTMEWATPAASAILAFALFGIDEIAVEIEDPFGYDANDLPLDAVGDTIARDVGDIARLCDGPLA
jgi:putative membrane protein